MILNFSQIFFEFRCEKKTGRKPFFVSSNSPSFPPLTPPPLPPRRSPSHTPNQPTNRPIKPKVLIRRELEEAAKVLGERIRTKTASPEDSFELGVILLRKKLYTSALKSLERARSGWDGAPADLAQVHNAIGYANFQLNKLDAAVASYEAAVALQPGCVFLSFFSLHFSPSFLPLPPSSSSPVFLRSFLSLEAPLSFLSDAQHNTAPRTTPTKKTATSPRGTTSATPGRSAASGPRPPRPTPRRSRWTRPTPSRGRGPRPCGPGRAPTPPPRRGRPAGESEGVCVCERERWGGREGGRSRMRFPAARSFDVLFLVFFCLLSN